MSGGSGPDDDLLSDEQHHQHRHQRHHHADDSLLSLIDTDDASTSASSGDIAAAPSSTNPQSSSSSSSSATAANTGARASPNSQTKNKIMLSKDKYDQLILDFKKHKSHNSVLKKAVIQEREKSTRLQEELEVKDLALRDKLEEISTLNFNNTRLEKRLTQVLLEFEDFKKRTTAKTQGGGFFSGLLPKGISAVELDESRKELEVAKEELESKIIENEQIHMQMFELRKVQEDTIRILEEKEHQLEATVRSRDEEIQRLKSDHENLILRHEEEITRNRTEMSSLKQELSVREERSFLLSQSQTFLQRRLDELNEFVDRKLPFDDTRVTAFNVLNLPPFDRRRLAERLDRYERTQILFQHLCRSLSNLAAALVERSALQSRILDARGSLSPQLLTHAQHLQRSVESMPAECQTNSARLLTAFEFLVCDTRSCLSPSKGANQPSQNGSTTGGGGGGGLSSTIATAATIPSGSCLPQTSSVSVELADWLGFIRTILVHITASVQQLDSIPSPDSNPTSSKKDQVSNASFSTQITSSGLYTVDDDRDMLLEKSPLTNAVVQLRKYLTRIADFIRIASSASRIAGQPKRRTESVADTTEASEDDSRSTSPTMGSSPVLKPLLDPPSAGFDNETIQSRLQTLLSVAQSALQTYYKHVQSRLATEQRDYAAVALMSTLSGVYPFKACNEKLCAALSSIESAVVKIAEIQRQYLITLQRASTEGAERSVAVRGALGVNVHYKAESVDNATHPSQQGEALLSPLQLTAQRLDSSSALESSDTTTYYYHTGQAGLTMLEDRARRYIRACSRQLAQEISVQKAEESHRQQQMDESRQKLADQEERVRVLHAHLKLADSTVRTLIDKYTNLCKLLKQRVEDLIRKDSGSLLEEFAAISSSDVILRKSGDETLLEPQAILGWADSVVRFVVRRFDSLDKLIELLRDTELRLKANIEALKHTSNSPSLVPKSPNLVSHLAEGSNYGSATSSPRSSGVVGSPLNSARSDSKSTRPSLPPPMELDSDHYGDTDSATGSARGNNAALTDEKSDFLTSFDAMYSTPHSESKLPTQTTNWNSQSEQRSPADQRAALDPPQGDNSQTRPNVFDPFAHTILSETRPDNQKSSSKVMYDGTKTRISSSSTDPDAELFGTEELLREAKLKALYENRIQYLLSQVEICDAKSVEFRIEWQNALLELEQKCAHEKELTLELQQTKHLLEDVVDERDTIRRNYEQQIEVLTEHVCQLKDTVGQQEDQISMMRGDKR